MLKPDRIDATNANYIKLGAKGRWETLCRDDGTLRLSYNGVPHAIAQTGDLDAMRRLFLDRGDSPRTATAHANQVGAFYSAGPETIWIMFSAGYMWWSVTDSPVEYIGGSEDEMERRGSRLRRTRDGWHNTSIGGAPLRISELNGALTRTAAYRMTICDVEQFDYLIRKINDEDLPDITAAKQARTELIRSTVALMRLLTWQDFELLVELVFSQSGWRRTGASGGTQKTVDIELMFPTTGELAFVQVKSRTDQKQFEAYLDLFNVRDDSRMFYVYHTATTDMSVAMDEVTLVGPDKLAGMILEAGLFDWLLRKVG